MVTVQTNFNYKKDEDGFYREVLPNGNLSDKRFKKLENLAGWVRVKFRLKLYGVIFALGLVFALLVLLFGR